MVLVFGVARTKGVTLDHSSEEKGLTAQMSVADVVTKTLWMCEIQSKGDTPKLTRCSVNLEMFRAIVGVISPGMQYLRRLQETRLAAWWKLGGAKKTGTQIAHRWGGESAKHIYGGLRA